MGDSIFDCVKEFPTFDSMMSSTIKDRNQVNKEQCEEFILDKLTYYFVDDQELYRFCAKAAYHVTDIKSNPENEIYPFCIYMIYWVYRKVFLEDVSKYSGVLKEFINSVPNSEGCEYYVDKIDQNIYEKLKTLHDLYDDFNKFKKETLPTNSDTYKNGNICVELYKKNVDVCNKNYKNGFCMKLIDFKKEYEEHMIQLKNYGNMPRYLPSIGSNVATSVSTPVVSMSLISFFSYISYKYTPLGSWIHPKLTGGKKRMNNLHQETEKIQYTSEYQENPYRISYQPSRYS
ncbi:PIR protein [Plasmodium vivax]|uniref:VIR protein n=1 Tax=Plasmodium vivax TaxID=5855 RepID=A0A565A5R4_PLAVI|nr:PIR protein [Plasmodium vivax]